MAQWVGCALSVPERRLAKSTPSLCKQGSIRFQAKSNTGWSRQFVPNAPHNCVTRGGLVMVSLFPLQIRKPLARGFPVSSSKLVMSLMQKIEPTHAHTFPHTFELSDR